MPAYLVLEPVTYTNADGSVTQWREAGHVVELSAEVAAEVGAALKLVDEAAFEVEDAETPARTARPRGKRRHDVPQPAEGAEGAVVSPFERPAPEAAAGTVEAPPGGEDG